MVSGLLQTESSQNVGVLLGGLLKENLFWQGQGSKWRNWQIVAEVTKSVVAETVQGLAWVWSEAETDRLDCEYCQDWEIVQGD